MSNSSFQVKDVDGLRLVRGVLPINKVPEYFSKWHREGYTHIDGDLNEPFKCNLVIGTEDALAKKRSALGMKSKAKFDKIK